MANTFIKIAAAEAGSGGSTNFDFTVIPATYTDLMIVVSARSTSTGDIFNIAFNGSSSSFTGKYVYWENTTANSGSLAQYGGRVNTSSTTASTFSSTSIYIPNYAGSTNKSYSSDSVSENNAAAAPGSMIAGLWSNTAAITQVTLTPSAGNFAQYSTATLYGISKS
jgi:hypothetical protein